MDSQCESSTVRVLQQRHLDAVDPVELAAADDEAIFAAVDATPKVIL
jgi:hypothetical protein